ncbi:HD domain-containing phosphohydrolase [uncultured Ruminococcus sp.]|uniref:HD-GYP domain-containing protein n=2 Tax=uncultured Ruminococcus sp. TaxID=165186 RepID=UPI00293156CA|nr:HD domain-containing phosphohydrolase [uncultured Ruminococcus sp.]
MSPNLRSKSSWKSIASLIGVIVVCILLNILGTKLNGVLGLPLFIDNIGTILSAMLGGYIPCITVGFFTNIIDSFADSFTIYYCIISVLIAVAAVSFAEKMRRLKIPYILLGIVTFAFLGGVVGGLLTWFINGLNFGEGYAVDMAARINSVVPMGYFLSNLLSVFLIDLVDKAIVTVIALVIYKLLPSPLLDFLHTRDWYYLTVFEQSNKHNRKRLSLRWKTTLVVAISTTLVASAAIGISILQYHNSTIAEFEEDGHHAIHVIAEKLNADRIDEYTEKGRTAEGYDDIEELLTTIVKASPDIKFAYIYSVKEDGTHVVFDVDSAGVKADEPGEVIRYDKSIEKYKDRFLAGESIPTDITDDEYGWLLSVYEPVKNSAGQVKCYIGIDMEMSRLRSDEIAFLAKIISLFLGFLILIRTYAVWLAERHIVKPINAIAHVSRHSSYDTPEAREKWISMLDALDIRTGDEIETLYEDYKRAAHHTVLYIEEIQHKSEQLTKLQNGLIMVLADMVESRDQCTGDHVFKTAAYTEIILCQMLKEGIYSDQLTEEYIAEVVNSAPLHDVGKVTVSDVILNKPGRLTDEEFRIMQSHTVEGGKIIDKAMAIVDEDSDYLTEAKNLALYHHEKWNGKGYPTGLKGEEIPLSARVMAVADVFDALVSRRSYKEPFTIEKALSIIREDAGTHFDPLVAQAFLDAEDEVRRVAKLNLEP